MKKYLSFIAVLLMCCILFSMTACRKKVDSSDNSSETTLTSTDSANSELSNQPDNSQTSEINSATTSNPSTSNPSTSNKNDPITFTLLTYEHVNQPYNTNAIKFKEIERKTSVKLDIDVTPTSSWSTKLTTVLASGKLYDIMAMDFSYLSKYSSSLFLDLTSYYKNNKIPNYAKWYNSDPMAKNVLIDNKMLCFSSFNAGDYPKSKLGETSPSDMLGLLPVIRYDILDKNNLAVPKTWDEWFSTMKKLKSVYPDSTPLGGRAVRYIFSTLEYQLGCQSDLHFDGTSKKFMIGVLNPRYKQVLEFEKRCYDEGILDPNFETSTSNSWNEGVLNSKIFFWIDNNGFADSQTKALQTSTPGAKMQVMPLMENLFGEKKGMMYAKNSLGSIFALSAKTKNPERLVSFMDWCYSDEGMYVNNYGKEGETYSVKKDGSVQIPQKIIDKYKKSTSNYAWQSDYGLGSLAFAPLTRTTDGIMDAMGKTNNEAYNIMKGDINAGRFTDRVDVLPVVSSDIMQKVTLINNEIYKTIPKFITGAKSMTEFDEFVTKIKNMGAQSVIDAYNSR